MVLQTISRYPLLRKLKRRTKRRYTTSPGLRCAIMVQAPCASAACRSGCVRSRFGPHLMMIPVEHDGVLVPPLAARAQEQGHAYYSHGLAVLAWLTGTSPPPPLAYLAGVLVPFPLMGLTQLVQYLVSCRVLGLHPGEMHSLINGATGHSWRRQRRLGWLFDCGLRSQEAFTVLTVEPSLVADCGQGCEGTPSPMLAVTALEITKFRPHIEKTNNHLPENSQLIVSSTIAARHSSSPARPFACSSSDSRTTASPLLWKAEELGTPCTIYKTFDGNDLRDLKASITRSLCEQIFSEPIFWEKACDFPALATRAVDFGPGGISGIGSVTQRNVEGRGVGVVGAAELYEACDAERVRRAEKWEEAFTPRLVKTLDGPIQIDTPFSRLLGEPPVMGAGMTLTTVKAGFVSAVLRAGYHVELAGGGQYNPAALRAKIPAGVGLTLNALYINQRHFGCQFSLWREMRREDVPAEGFCVAAIIPSTEKAVEIIGALKASGIHCIASAKPDFPIIMQWIEENIALVAGPGFGAADEVWPYVTGDWSKEMFGVERMPFDGVLFASWVLIAKEAHTSEAVKQMIVNAPGMGNAQWEGTYKETGGILTVKSELGEPILKIATRPIKLWKEYDESVFALPKEKRIQRLAQNKDKAIARLNADFQKPWFPSKADGSVVGDIGDMTSAEWMSPCNLVGDWLRRVEERFAGVNGQGSKASVLQSFNSLDGPETFLTKFFETYHASKEPLVASEDKAYFLASSQRPGQKPVPFIPGSTPLSRSDALRSTLKVGDVCSSNASISPVTNIDSGKFVTVMGHLLRGGRPVTSSFLYRGRLSDLQNTFEKTIEPEFEVELQTAAQVGVLQSEEWTQWDDDATPLQLGTTLVFKTGSEVFYKEKASYSGVHVVGAACIRHHTYGLVKATTIDYEGCPTQGNQVTAYLNRHGKQIGIEVMFENAASPTPPRCLVTFNPIHVNPYFSCYAALPGTTTHGMCSSAATRKYVESVAAQGCPERVLSYNVTLVGMVLPGNELNDKLTHIGMKNDNILVKKVLTTNVVGDKIINGMAEVPKPPAAYVFTGQGSQERNMGIQLYNSSAAAKAVWDAADEILTNVYGFSIIDIVRNNAKSKTIHFGGIKS
ncbi:hypothetical protein CALVIDRAFT_603464 [Calocera viscosa TUFC12733]|uniref:Uncharacterized protein n=1 Tax=Calocera viscosa (strain TUFC12733) TaxID=1330018 RepID=A0A167FPI1_CALVF|nr:hypothetical protein CALVIDRAFT_603464 [Calocera viscosa TUFC12733]